MKGSLAENLTILEVAKYHNLEDFEYENFMKQYHKGVEVEKEHTSDESVAQDIAKDHLYEDKDYYNKLEKMERKNHINIHYKGSILNKEIKIVRKSGNEKKYEKQVEEVNRLIQILIDKDLSIIDGSSTWQAPIKYKPFKYVNGVLYEEYEELDLYKSRKFKKETWNTVKNKVKKQYMWLDNPIPNVMRLIKRKLRYEGINY